MSINVHVLRSHVAKPRPREAVTSVFSISCTRRCYLRVIDIPLVSKIKYPLSVRRGSSAPLVPRHPRVRCRIFGYTVYIHKIAHGASRRAHRDPFSLAGFPFLARALSPLCGLVSHCVALRCETFYSTIQMAASTRSTSTSTRSRTFQHREFLDAETSREWKPKSISLISREDPDHIQGGYRRYRPSQVTDAARVWDADWDFVGLPFQPFDLVTDVRAEIHVIRDRPDERIV